MCKRKAPGRLRPGAFAFYKCAIRMKRIAVLQGAKGSVSAVLAQQACPCTGNRQCKAAESHCQRSKQAGAGLRQGVSVLHSGIRGIGGQNSGVRRISPCVLYGRQLRVFRGDGGIRAGLRFRFRVGVRVGSVGPVRVGFRLRRRVMRSLEGKSIAADGDDIACRLRPFRSRSPCLPAGRPDW